MKSQPEDKEVGRERKKYLTKMLVTQNREQNGLRLQLTKHLSSSRCCCLSKIISSVRTCMYMNITAVTLCNYSLLLESSRLRLSIK